MALLSFYIKCSIEFLIWILSTLLAKLKIIINALMETLYKFRNGCPVEIKRVLYSKHFSDKEHIFFIEFYSRMVVFVFKNIIHDRPLRVLYRVC